MQQLYSGPVESFARADTVLLFDCNNLIFRSAAVGGGPRHVDLGEFGHRRQLAHLQGFHQLVVNAWRDYGRPYTTTLVFGFDGPGAKGPRQEIYPAYKANRQDKPDHFLELLGIPRPQALDELRRLCGALPGHLMERPGVEFDDLAYSLVDLHPKQYILFSSDQDMWALIDRFPVRVVGQAEVGTALLYDKLGLRSFRQVATYKMLFGDRSDNIPSLLPRLRRQPVAEFLGRLEDPEALPTDQLIGRLRAEVETTRKFIDQPGFMEDFYRNQALVWFHRYDPVLSAFSPGDRAALEELQLGGFPWF